MKKIFIAVVLFSTLIASIQAQVGTNTSGDYNACLTWSDQSQIGFSPALIRGATTVTLRNNANTYQSLAFSSASSTLDLNGKTLNLNNSTGAINMDFCPVSFAVSSYTSNSNGCTPLWGGANNNWPYTDYGFSYGPETQCIQAAIINLPGYYRIRSGSLALIATFPNGPGLSKCGTNNFYVEATVKRNGATMSGPYVIMTSAGGNAGTYTNPNCVSGYTQSTNLEFQRYSVTGSIDFGYCFTGDVITICFNSTKLATSCGTSFGSMCGLAVYAIETY